ncbi:MAG: hydrogenase [Deltaproteobacteria bacterium]|nr:hydrogenase [Deltaproteobacteria bacterium]
MTAASSSLVVHTVAIADVPELEVRAWRNWVKAELLQGSRPVILYGTRTSETRVALTMVLQRGDGGLDLIRTSVDPTTGYFALSEVAIAMHAFERELHEQFALRLTAHPWLKPLRYEGGTQADMARYPYYKLEGKEVHEVAVGPIHAGVIEPGAFRFMCHGETVHHLEIQLGYQHRGVEALLGRGDPRRHTPLVETIAGDTSVAHAWAHCAALEALAGVALPSEGEIARALMLELERIAMHLAGLTGLAADIGFLQGAATYGRLRTTAINTSMRLCGSRFGRGAIRPGGAGVGLDDGARDAVRDACALLRDHLVAIDALFLEARSVAHRLRGVGRVNRAMATQLGLVGFAARASGVDLDQRRPARGAYAAVPLARTLETTGDCWARARLRITEIAASLGWIEAALAHLAPMPADLAIGALAPATIAIAIAEGWRGEVVHVLETDAAGGLARHKVQDPSLRNWLGLAIAVRDNEISDFPICNKSFDLSYCGHDL